MQELNDWGLLDNWITATRNPAKAEWLWRPDYRVVDLSQLEFHPAAYRSYRVDAAQRLVQGKQRIALAVSGGIDSQAMLQSFVEAGIDFDIATMVFNYDYNSHDVEFARQTAERYGRKIVEIPLDVMRFLQLQLWDYAEKYQCNSPQFSCHHWFYEQLISLGYDCVIAGGHTWIPWAGNTWIWGNTPARHAWWTFAQVNQFALRGNFLASTWQLNCAITLNYPLHEQVDDSRGKVTDDDETGRLIEAAQYQKKVLAFRNFGFDIIPQKNKFTGFEKVKAYFNDAAQDPYTFESRFRWPLQERWPDVGGRLVLEDYFSAQLLDIKKSTPSLSP